MSTPQLRLAVDTAPMAAHYSLGNTLAGMRLHSASIVKLTDRCLLALADMDETGELDPQLVSELLEAPTSLGYVTAILTTSKEVHPESAVLVDALLDELTAAREQSEKLRAETVSDLDGDTVPGEWK